MVVVGVVLITLGVRLIVLGLATPSRRSGLEKRAPITVTVPREFLP